MILSRRFIQIKFIFVVISIVNCDLIHNLYDNDDYHHHFTNWSILRRNRRGLIFNGGGTAKFVGGAIYPLYLEDKVHWRQVNCLYNFQAQYTVPSKPTYWWDKWYESSRSSPSSLSLFSTSNENRKSRKFHKKSIIPDDSRKFIYLALENFMNINGKNGKKCLLRSICENGQITEHIGIFSEFLHILLKPGKEILNDEYKEAYKAGEFGANCLSLYPECPLGNNFFDSFTVIV